MATANVGTMRGRTKEVVEMLVRRKVDICCVQKTQYEGDSSKVIGEGGHS